MRTFNRQTPITNALGWGHVHPDSAYWVLQDGKCFSVMDKHPETQDNKGVQIPNIVQSGFLVDLSMHGKYEEMKQSGDISDAPGTQGINPEIYDDFVTLDKYAKKYGHRGMDYVKDQIIQQSGPIQYDDFANVKKVRDAIFFYGKAYRNHILTQMVSQQTTNYLDFRAIRFTPPDNQIWDDMGFYALPEMTKGQYAEVSRALKSQAYLFSITEDFYYNDYQVNPIADHQRALNAEVDLALNNKIAGVIKAIASAGNTDWTTLNASNLITTNDPSEVMRGFATTIIKKDRWNVDSVLSNYGSILKYIRNQHVNGDISDQANVARPSLLTGIANNVKFLDGIKWGWDDLIEESTDNKFILYASEAFKLTLGPRKVARVTDPISGTITNLVRYWCDFNIYTFGDATEVYTKRTIT